MLTLLSGRAAKTGAAGVGSPTLVLSTATLTFNATAGGSDPTPQTITVSRGGSGVLAGPQVSSASYVGVQTGWLPTATYDPVTHVLTVAPTTGALPAADHTALFAVTDGKGGTVVVTVTISVAAAAAPRIQVNTAPVTFSSAVGSDPTPQSRAITNGGSGTLATVVPTITYGGGEPTGWLTATVTGSGNSQTFTLTPAAGALTAQTLTYSVSLASTGADNTPQTITGSYTLAAAGAFPALKVATVQNEFGVPLTHNTATDAIEGDLFDTSWVARTGTVRRVTEQGSPAANATAYNAAQTAAVRGDWIVWDDGMVFEQVNALKDYGAGTGWVYYMPASEYNRATATTMYGTGVFPVDAPVQGDEDDWGACRVPWTATSLMGQFYATTKSQNETDAAIRTTASSGCSYIRLIGMEITTNPAWTGATNENFIGNMAILGLYGKPNAAVDAAHMPHHIIMDRCIVKPQSGHHVKRGLMVVTEKTAVIGCRIWTDYKFKTSSVLIGDAQAFSSDECPGWLLLEGNEFKGGYEACFLGGYTTPMLAPAAPTHDVIVRGNWIHQETDGVHTYWTKNCFESKGTVRLLVERNVISHLKGDSQFEAIVCKVDRTAEGGNTSTDTLIRYNYVHDVCGGLLLGGLEGTTGTAIAPVGIQVYNNLFRRINIAPYNTSGTQYAHQFTDRPHAWIHNNTMIDVVSLSGSAFVGGSPYSDSLEIRDNIWPFGSYGYVATGINGYTGGINALQQSNTSVTWNNEVFFGVSGAQVNGDNTFKNAAWSGRGHQGFTAQSGIGLDTTADNGHLAAGNALLTAASDGGPVGVNNWTPFTVALYAVES